MTTTPSMSALSAESIETRLIERIAALTNVDACAIDPDQPIAGYGLTSVLAVGLSAELEDWLGIAVEATIVWDHPTIEGLAARLAEAVRDRSG